MKNVTLLLLVFTVNAYSQICLKMKKDTIVDLLKNNPVVYNIKVYKDSIYCNTNETGSVGESIYLFKNDTCFKQIFIENLKDSTYFKKQLEDVYCHEAYPNTWIKYKSHIKRTEIVRLVYINKKAYIYFTLD